MSGAAGSPHRGNEAVRIGIGSAIVLVLTGAVIGLVGGFLQAVTVTVAGIALPVGVVVVVLALIATIRAVIHVFDRRWAGVWVFLGWVVVSALLAYQWPGGDVVIAREPTAMVYLFGGALLASAAANLPARLRPPSASESVGGVDIAGADDDAATPPLEDADNPPADAADTPPAEQDRP